MKNKSGITLIALIITIIILLILAGISINILVGDNGIIKNATQAAFFTEVSDIKERVERELNREYVGSLNEFLGEDNKYNGKLSVQEGTVVYNSENASDKEIEWFEQLGIKKASEYYTVEFNLGEDEPNVVKLVKSGKKVNIEDIPKVENSYFQGWYYLKESGSEDDPIYTELKFDAENTLITSDYFIYAKYYNQSVMIAKKNSLQFWAHRSEITDIIFTSDSNLIPSTYETAESLKTNDSNAADIIAYMENTSTEEETTYKATVYCQNTIYANQNCTNLFYNFSKLENINFNNFNTQKTINMLQMFRKCGNLKNLDLSYFKTENVTSMRNMFMDCFKLESLDISNFTTSKVKLMGNMFSNCKVLKNINVENFNTSNVTSMGGMFYRCKELTQLDLSSFDTRKVISFYEMFRGTNKLNIIYVGANWTTKNATTTKMFYDCGARSVTLKEE